eukprot:NODE_1694_length_1439_cov_31.931655_g1529_i0.p1 GENE.NODE_1694_length_1439_cov_31.931655_g1529_i0~~NODE_1694_length_1439_cov_31.931655_g1529_i0.p1  ORF type:complete len:189 (+),score=39.79 NODE_1694_length_1439_cov_31.931655_g1529_i0:731-1297(+)
MPACIWDHYRYFSRGMCHEELRSIDAAIEDYRAVHAVYRQQGADGMELARAIQDKLNDLEDERKVNEEEAAKIRAQLKEVIGCQIPTPSSSSNSPTQQHVGASPASSSSPFPSFGEGGGQPPSRLFLESLSISQLRDLAKSRVDLTDCLEKVDIVEAILKVSGGAASTASAPKVAQVKSRKRNREEAQ